MYEVRACLTPSSKPDPVVGRSCQKKERHPNQNAIYFPPDAPSRFPPLTTTNHHHHHKPTQVTFRVHDSQACSISGRVFFRARRRARFGRLGGLGKPGVATVPRCVFPDYHVPPLRLPILVLTKGRLSL